MNVSSNVTWFIERRFWRDKYGRPLLPLGYKSLETEEAAPDKDSVESTQCQQ